MALPLLINGKVENIFDGEDFARLLGEKLGSDAENYFRENWLVFCDYDPENLKQPCTGECDTTYKLQEHYENVLQDIKDRLQEILSRKDTNYNTVVKGNLILNLINSEL